MNVLAPFLFRMQTSVFLLPPFLTFLGGDRGHRVLTQAFLAFFCDINNR